MSKEEEFALNHEKLTLQKCQLEKEIFVLEKEYVERNRVWQNGHRLIATNEFNGDRQEVEVVNAMVHTGKYSYGKISYALRRVKKDGNASKFRLDRQSDYKLSEVLP